MRRITGVALLLLLCPAPAAHAQALPASGEAVLVGVILDDARGIRAAMIHCAWPGAPARDHFLVPGESVCGRATLAEVLPAAVRLAAPDGERRLALHDSARTHAAFPAVAGPAVASVSPVASPRVSVNGGRTTITVTEDELRAHTANLAALASEAVATPRLGTEGAGQLDGFVMSAVRPDGLLARLGILDGDIVTSLNGEPLRGVVPILSALSSLPATRRATVGVERGGAHLEFEVRVE